MVALLPTITRANTGTTALAANAVLTSKPQVENFQPAQKATINRVGWKPTGLKAGVGQSDRASARQTELLDEQAMKAAGNVSNTFSVYYAGLQAELDDMQMELEADQAARSVSEIAVMVDQALSSEISSEDAATELRRIKAECRRISRMSGQEQIEHCLVLLRSMSSLTSNEAKTFLHGWGCFILRHF